MNATDLATWIEDEQFPLVAKMSAATFRRLAKGQKKVVIGVLEETLVEGRLAKPSMCVPTRQCRVQSHLTHGPYCSNIETFYFSQGTVKSYYRSGQSKPKSLRRALPVGSTFNHVNHRQWPGRH